MTVVRYLAHLKALLASELTLWIGRALPWLIRRSLRRGLRGVWWQGELAALAGGFVLVANHHSWWDAYLMFALRERLGGRLSGLMQRETLARFPFFRRIGVIGELELREALRRLRAGEGLAVFAEGALSPPAQLAPLKPGAAYLAHKAQVPLVPLAIRVVMRGAERPEAYLLLGQPIAPCDTPEATLARCAAELNRMLGELDGQLRAAPAEVPLAGFEAWTPLRRSFHEHFDWLRRLWS